MIEKTHETNKVELGFQPEFIETLTENVFDLLREKTTGNVQNLIDNGYFLSWLLLQNERGHLSVDDVSDLGKVVGETSKLIWQLGGEFKNKHRTISNDIENKIPVKNTDMLGFTPGYIQMLVEEGLTVMGENSTGVFKELAESIGYLWYAVNEYSKGADLESLDRPGILAYVENIKRGINQLGGEFSDDDGIISNSQGEYIPGDYVSGEFVEKKEDDPFDIFKDQIICNRCNSVLGERVQVEGETVHQYGGAIFHNAEGVCSECGNNIRITEKPGKAGK